MKKCVTLFLMDENSYLTSYLMHDAFMWKEEWEVMLAEHQVED